MRERGDKDALKQLKKRSKSITFKWWMRNILTLLNSFDAFFIHADFITRFVMDCACEVSNAAKSKSFCPTASEHVLYVFNEVSLSLCFFISYWNSSKV